MTLTFVLNFVSLHQLPLCEELYKLLGENFTVIETEEMYQNRKDLGFTSYNRPYIINVINNKENQEKADKLIEESDVVLFGHAVLSILYKRLSTKKLTFKYSERYFKGSSSLVNKLKFYVRAKRFIKPFDKLGLYFLGASAYLAHDVNKYADFTGKTFKWAYFNQIEKLDIEDLWVKKEPKSILWVGRMIDWKHPETIVFVADKLKREGVNFKLNVIGTGPEEEKLKNLVNSKGLNDCVTLLGVKSPSEVLEYMKKSQIFIASSDFNEGWGMTINEAMSCGMAVIASHAMGATPFLISHGKNGYIYPYNNNELLYKYVKNLLNDSEKARDFGKQAYNTMATEWNAEVGAKRFIELAQSMLGNAPIPEYSSGPCSMAKILKNNWIGKGLDD